MNGPTHLLFALFCILFTQQYFHITNIYLFSFFVFLAAFIVDIDSAKSKVGRKMWPLSAFIEFILKHRGVVHSIWIPLIFYYLMNPLSHNIALGFVVGYVSHLFLDALTIQGVTFIYPFKSKIRGFIKTGGVVEKIVQGVIVVGIIALLLQ